MDDLIKNYLEELQQTNTCKKYDECLNRFMKLLIETGYETEILQAVRIKGRYMTNKFSDESTRENMLNAKENLLTYLNGIIQEEQKEAVITKQECLREYLFNFYFFLEAFRETKPHKKATLSSEVLKNIQIQNEYDLQHLVYAVLKPLCADMRAEVVEDNGCGMVRSDIKIPSLRTIIETKCTRANMSLKKLTEEIEADIVHYEADYIYFYIYDKEKIIKNRQAFQTTFHRVFDGKQVEVIILQPVYV